MRVKLAIRRFRRRTFWTGVASIIDVYGALFRPRPRGNFQSDADAIRRDWEAIGGDLRRATERFNNDLRGHVP